MDEASGGRARDSWAALAGAVSWTGSVESAGAVAMEAGAVNRSAVTVAVEAETAAAGAEDDPSWKSEGATACEDVSSLYASAPRIDSLFFAGKELLLSREMPMEVSRHAAPNIRKLRFID